MKRALREAGEPKHRVGHGGTLDPLASGVLPIAIGEATKVSGRMLDASKSYEFTVRFGEETDTLDLEGKVVATSEVRPSRDQIETVITGVRPGEKEHEILVSDEECRHTYRRGDSYYAIAPMLPELASHATGQAPLTREYSSADAPVSMEEAAALLRRHELMVDQVDLAEGELLR